MGRELRQQWNFLMLGKGGKQNTWGVFTFLHGAPTRSRNSTVAFFPPTDIPFCQHSTTGLWYLAGREIAYADSYFLLQETGLGDGNSSAFLNRGLWSEHFAGVLEQIPCQGHSAVSPTPCPPQRSLSSCCMFKHPQTPSSIGCAVNFHVKEEGSNKYKVKTQMQNPNNVSFVSWK